MAITLIDIGLLAVVFIIALYYYGMKSYDHFKNTDVKHKKPPLPFLGTFWSVSLRREALHTVLKRTYDKFSNEKYIGYFNHQTPIVMIKDLDLLKKVGIKDFDTFHDHRNFIGGNPDDLFINSLFIMRGEKWREMRAALSPAFTGAKMRNMFVFIEECAKEMTDYLTSEKEVKENGMIELNIKDLATRYTNDVIATSAFGVKVNSLKDRDNEFFEHGKLSSEISFVQILKFYGFTFFPGIMKSLNISFTNHNVSNFFRSLVKKTMENREKTGVIRHDMINLLMEAQKGTLKHEVEKESSEAGFATVQESSIGKKVIRRKWTDVELAGQAFVFFLAGFDTSSTLITFFFYEMVRNPDIQKKLQEEIDNFNLKSEGKLSYNDVQQLKYLDMTISETLRMWPPLASVDRECSKAYKLPPPNESSAKPYMISAGQSILIPVYGLLHDSKYFPDPDKFDPERFSDENKDSINPITYLPFGIGPRNCIGSRFALMEIKLIAFHILSKFDIVKTEKTQIPIEFDKGSLRLKTKGAVFVGLKQRLIK